MKVKKCVLWMLALLLAFGFAVAVVSCGGGGGGGGGGGKKDHSDECKDIVNSVYVGCDYVFLDNNGNPLSQNYVYDDCKDNWNDNWACAYECYKAETTCDGFIDCLIDCGQIV